MKKRILLLLFVLTHSILFGQGKKDSILVNERTIDRPLTLHKGQLQIKTGYNISIIAANFNENGNKTNLAELGNAFVAHQYNFDIRYGIFNFLELRTELNYNKRGVRKTNEIFLSLYEPMIDISYLDNYKGFNDLYIGAGFSYPFFKNKLEIFFEPGITPALFPNEPNEPDHEYIPHSEEQDYTKIYYVYNYKYATGTNVFHFGAGGKFRTKNLGLTVLYKSAYPLNISESISWKHRLIGTDFEYYDEKYDFLISDMNSFLIKAEYQALPWFNVSIDFSGITYKNGWSEEFLIRLANPEPKLFNLTAGCEIKITEKLWFTQFVSFPVAGENQIAPISFVTNLAYNFFPFHN